LNLFSWSLPFLAEKVTSMLFSILKNCTLAELKDLDDEIPAQDVMKVVNTETAQAEEKLKRKIMLK
jgi:hypothetical protein